MSKSSFDPDDKNEEKEEVVSSLYAWGKFFYGPLLERRSQLPVALPPIRFKSKLVEEAGLDAGKRKHLFQQLDFIFQFGGWEKTQIKVEALDGKEYDLTRASWKDLQNTVFPKVLHPSQEQLQNREWKGIPNSASTVRDAREQLEGARERLKALKKAMEKNMKHKDKDKGAVAVQPKAERKPVTLEPLVRRPETPAAPGSRAPGAAGPKMFNVRQHLQPVESHQRPSSRKPNHRPGVK